MELDNIRVRRAFSDEDFKQIYQLNYETFVEEIQQHNQNDKKELIDQFDHENIYYIVEKENFIIGMIALRDRRPFSLDKKLENLDSYLPPHQHLVEIRLLSIRKEFRNSKMLFILLKGIMEERPEDTYDLAVISGIVSQLKLYKHIGFVEFGPLVGKEGAYFQPMYLSKESYFQMMDRWNMSKNDIVNLLPGPVEISKNVKEAFAKDPISHRANIFKIIFDRTKQQLLKITGAKYVEILTGSGTTANDVVAGQISLLNEKGLILSNGEFGERLFRHAENFNLQYSKIQKNWGESFSISEIESFLTKTKAKWIWFVHHETSTGMLNDLEAISSLCNPKGIKVCLDTISSLGTVHLDLSKIYFASAVSSKGLASFTGLSIIFYNHSLERTHQTLPSYFNLSIYQHAEGIPYTISSNLVLALDQSLQNFNHIEHRIKLIKSISESIRKDLKAKGISILVEEAYSSPSTITIVLDQHQDSLKIGKKLRENGILVSYESAYLVEKNWIQICFMGGEPSYEKTKRILKFL